MKRFLQIAGPLYVVFALITAHTALAPAEKTFADSGSQRSEVVTSTRTLLNSERVDRPDSRAAVARADYTIEVWTASWCKPCQTWQRRELPALLRLGYNVVVRDIDKEAAPKDIKSVPTVRLYYKGDFITQQVYWQAKDIERFVKGRLSLKK